MKSLDAFLHPVEREHLFVPISDRFVDEKGEPIPFEFRPISHEENKAINRRCTRKGKKGEEEFDLLEYKWGLAAASIVYPDLCDAALQEGLGTQGDEVKTLKALLPTLGEFSAAFQVAQEANGFGRDTGRELEEAKNASGRA